MLKNPLCVSSMKGSGPKGCNTRREGSGRYDVRLPYLGCVHHFLEKLKFPPPACPLATVVVMFD